MFRPKGQNDEVIVSRWVVFSLRKYFMAKLCLFGVYMLGVQMKNELSVLIKINKDGNTTQRDIAKTTGMSLGNVNVLIKRLVNKGLLKMEKISPRTISYVLTPKGFREKTEATYRYIIDSFRLIQELSKNIESFLDGDSCYDTRRIVLLGQKDELYHLIVEKLTERNTEFSFFNELNDIVYNKANLNCYRIIIWSPQYCEILNSQDIEYVNLLDTIWRDENEAKRIRSEND